MSFIESILTRGRELFPNNKKNEGSITLGFSRYLIITMAVMHLTFGTLLTTNHFIGKPLSCIGEIPGKEEYCGSESHVHPVGPGRQAERRYAYFRLTHWILLAIGKLILMTPFV